MAITTWPILARPVMLRQWVKPPIGFAIRALRRTYYGAEENLDLGLILIAIRNFQNLCESLLADCGASLLEGPVMPLNDRSSYRALPLLISLYAGFKRGVHENEGHGDLMLPCQLQQVLASLGSQRCGIDHTKAIRYDPLFNDEMDQGKCLCVEALVALVIANLGTRPV